MFRTFMLRYEQCSESQDFAALLYCFEPACITVVALCCCIADSVWSAAIDPCSVHLACLQNQLRAFSTQPSYSPPASKSSPQLKTNPRQAVEDLKNRCKTGQRVHGTHVTPLVAAIRTLEDRKLAHTLLHDLEPVLNSSEQLQEDRYLCNAL